MKTARQWLAEYSATHQHPVNKKIHTFCVPAIAFSVLGLAWHLQIPGFWWANAASAIALFSLIFYARLGTGPMAMMTATLATMFGVILALEWETELPMVPIYLGIFIVAWIGQFVGHHIEGKAPSFFEDLKFLLIGPLWVFYQRLFQRD